MPVNEADARRKAKELVQRLAHLRTRKMSEVDEAESALRTFAATHATRVESELEELRDRVRDQKRTIQSIQLMLRQYQERR